MIIILTPILLWGQWWMWQHQFEADERYAVVRFAAQQDAPIQVMRGNDTISWNRNVGQLALAVQAGKERPTVQIPLDAWPQEGYLLVKIRMRALGLVKGEEDWALARGIVLWRDRRGGCYPDHIPVAAVKADEVVETHGVVSLTHEGRPFFCLQHLGLAGSCRVETLELQLLRRCSWFLPLQIGFAVLWLGWWWGVWRALGCVQPWNVSMAVAVALAYGSFHFLVFPGPYLPLRGIQQPFVLAENRQATVPDAQLPATKERLVRFDQGASNVSGDVPTRGHLSWGMEALMWLKKQLRPIFHGLGFALFALIFMMLLQGSLGLVPVVMLATCSEGMQYLYGFGFGWEDVVDLTVNGCGIWLGWKMWKWIVSFLHQKHFSGSKKSGASRRKQKTSLS